MLSKEDIDTQLDRLAAHRQSLAHYLKQQAIHGEAYAPPAVANGIREARINIRRIKQVLRDNGVAVSNHPDDGNDVYEVPQSTPPSISAPPIAPGTVDRIKLRQVLTDYFNEDELRDLCFDLGIDYENLPGSSKSGKARELIAYAQRRGRLEDLTRLVTNLRPNVRW